MLNIQKRIFLLFMLFFVALSAQAGSTEKAAINKAYKEWCSAISEAKGDPKVMVKFYAPDAILLPTFYPKILINMHGGLNDYFTTFTKQADLKCIPVTSRVQFFKDTAVNSGFYDFTYTEKDGKTKTIPARFTFVYELIDNKWLIIEHHSSMKPTKKEVSR